MITLRNFLLLSSFSPSSMSTLTLHSSWPDPCLIISSTPSRGPQSQDIFNDTTGHESDNDISNNTSSDRFDELRKTDKLWKQRTGAEKQAKHAEAAQLVMEPVTAAVIPIYPPKVWEDISPQFCTTFWSLTMYDLYVPEKLYEKEIKKLKEAPAKLIDNKDLNSARRKKEADRLNTLMERLQVKIMTTANINSQI